ncbi:MAG: type II secretion system F family protein, partial [Acidimicrobiales bacterium]
GPARPSLGSSAPLGQILAPVLRSWGSRLAAALGAREDAGLRLARVHSSLDATSFRARQLAWSAAAFAMAILVAAVARLPPALSALVVLGAPLLAFLIVEQRLSQASARWQRQVLYELPVVSEQLAMLLAAGFSLGAAIRRLAERGRGCCAVDLGVVAKRIGYGLDAGEAMREWAGVAKVDAVDRLVAVLALHSEAADLERLVAAEARQARREVHRGTVELIERRSESVWVPVTVATLVPGVILIAVPFMAALHTFSNA